MCSQVPGQHCRARVLDVVHGHASKPPLFCTISCKRLPLLLNYICYERLPRWLKDTAQRPPPVLRHTAKRLQGLKYHC
eukprot:7348209-Pyramimonas_sp.AAC.1